MTATASKNGQVAVESGVGGQSTKETPRDYALRWVENLRRMLEFRYYTSDELAYLEEGLRRVEESFLASPPDYQGSATHAREMVNQARMFQDASRENHRQAVLSRALNLLDHIEYMTRERQLEFISVLASLGHDVDAKDFPWLSPVDLAEALMERNLGVGLCAHILNLLDQHVQNFMALRPTSNPANHNNHKREKSQRDRQIRANMKGLSGRNNGKRS